MAQSYSIILPWKSFNVNVNMLDTELKTRFPSYDGALANSILELLFTADPALVPVGGQSVAAQVQTMWAAIISSSAEATSYQTWDQIQAAAATAKATNLASATSKLTALGLTSAEIAAIMGQ